MLRELHNVYWHCYLFGFVLVFFVIAIFSSLEGEKHEKANQSSRKCLMWYMIYNWVVNEKAKYTCVILRHKFLFNACFYTVLWVSFCVGILFLKTCELNDMKSGCVLSVRVCTLHAVSTIYTLRSAAVC